MADFPKKRSDLSGLPKKPVQFHVEPAREDNDVVYCNELDSKIEVRGCVDKGGIVAMHASVSNISYLMLIGILNGLIGSLGRVNDNDYSGYAHKELSFSCILFFFFLFIKSPPMHMNVALEIYPCLMPNVFIDNMMTSDLVSRFLFYF